MNVAEQKMLEDYYLRRLFQRDYLKRLGEIAQQIK